MHANGVALNLQFRNDLTVLDPNRLLIRRYLEAHGVELRAVQRIEVVFDELATNIIRHGCADALPHAIEVNVSIHQDHVALVFGDDGRAFDPSTVVPPLLPRSIDQAKPGGLGLILLRKMTREFSYERIGSRNITRISLATHSTGGTRSE